MMVKNFLTSKEKKLEDGLEIIFQTIVEPLRLSFHAYIKANRLLLKLTYSDKFIWAIKQVINMIQYVLSIVGLVIGFLVSVYGHSMTGLSWRENLYINFFVVGFAAAIFFGKLSAMIFRDEIIKLMKEENIENLSIKEYIEKIRTSMYEFERFELYKLAVVSLVFLAFSIIGSIVAVSYAYHPYSEKAIDAGVGILNMIITGVIVYFVVKFIDPYYLSNYYFMCLIGLVISTESSLIYAYSIDHYITEYTIYLVENIEEVNILFKINFLLIICFTLVGYIVGKLINKVKQ